jgi:hypothetical protein
VPGTCIKKRITEISKEHQKNGITDNIAELGLDDSG